jgi:hypothetical protein
MRAGYLVSRADGSPVVIAAATLWLFLLVGRAALAVSFGIAPKADLWPPSAAGSAAILFLLCLIWSTALRYLQLRLQTHTWADALFAGVLGALPALAVTMARVDAESVYPPLRSGLAVVGAVLASLLMFVVATWHQAPR